MNDRAHDSDATIVQILYSKSQHVETMYVAQK